MDYYQRLIEKIKQDALRALEELGYKRDVFINEFQLTDDALSFVKDKNKKVSEKLEELEAKSYKITPILDLSKALQSSKECCKVESVEQYNGIVERDQNVLQKAFKCIFKNEENKYFIQAHNTKCDKFFLKNTKEFILKKFIPQLKTLILSKAKEQNYIKDEKKQSEDVFKEILEKSEKDFLELDKEKNNIWGGEMAAIGVANNYNENYKKLAFLNNLNLDSDGGNDYLENSEFIEEEREFNRLLKNLRELKRNEVYYTGDLEIFSK